MRVLEVENTQVVAGGGTEIGNGLNHALKIGAAAFAGTLFGELIGNSQADEEKVCKIAYTVGAYAFIAAGGFALEELSKIKEL